MTSLKFCRDCLHMSDLQMCLRTRTESLKAVNLVTGKQDVEQDMRTCNWERYNSDGSCGPDARHFIRGQRPRQHQSWWRRMFP